MRRVERRLENPEWATGAKEAEARRKRVRRVEDGKEDRDAMRELACSHDDNTLLELELTPEGLRETATDGTPRSARAAGAKLRQLTDSFYSRLQDPRQFDMPNEKLQALRVQTEFWDTSIARRQGWALGSRPLRIFKGKTTLIDRADLDERCVAEPRRGPYGTVFQWKNPAFHDEEGKYTGP